MDEFSDFQMAPSLPTPPPPPQGQGTGSRLANYNLSQQQQQPQVPPQQLNTFISTYNNNNTLLMGEEDKYAALRALVFEDEPQENKKNDGKDLEVLYTAPPHPQKDKIQQNSQLRMESMNVEPGVGGGFQAAEEDDEEDFGDFQSFTSLHSIDVKGDGSNSVSNGVGTSNNNGGGLKDFGDFFYSSNNNSSELFVMKSPPMPSMGAGTFPNATSTPIIGSNQSVGSISSGSVGSLPPLMFTSPMTSSKVKVEEDGTGATSWNLPLTKTNIANHYVPELIPVASSPSVFLASDSSSSIPSTDLHSSSTHMNITTHSVPGLIPVTSSSSNSTIISSSSATSYSSPFTFSSPSFSDEAVSSTSASSLPPNSASPLDLVELTRIFDTSIPAPRHNPTIVEFIGSRAEPPPLEEEDEENEVETPTREYEEEDDCEIPIPSTMGLSQPPPTFLKTSMIGCDNTLDSTMYTSFSSESSTPKKSAKEEGNSSKFDISPETRSIASLDLGTYVPPEASKSPEEENVGVEGSDIKTYQEGEVNGEIETSNKNNEEMTYVWKKLLPGINERFREGIRIIEGASSSDVIREVLNNEAGRRFVQCLSEIHLVFSRIKWSHEEVYRKGEGEDYSFRKELNEGKDLWSILASYLIGAIDSADELILSPSPSLSQITNSAPSQPSTSCGICYSPLEDTKSPSPKEKDPEGVITLLPSESSSTSNRSFHTRCANLWINAVKLRLPSSSITET